MRKAFVIFFLLMISVAVYAQRIDYDLRGCSLTDDDRNKFQRIAEYESAFFSDVFGNQRTQTIRIRMYGDEKKFRNGQRLVIGRIISETGVYAPLPKLVIVHKWRRYLPTVYHEMSHAIFHHYARFRPDWIDEGMAEYFKTAAIDSAGNIALSEIAYRRADMKKYVADSGFTIVKTLRASNRQFHGPLQHDHYTISWGLVNFLRRQHDAVFRKILYRIGTGVNSVKAIDAEYAGGVAQLQKDVVLFYK